MAHITRFRVKGNVAFPLDMMRHDRCWPVNTSDALKIQGSVTRMIRDRVCIELETADPAGPTPARWSSFGWQVVAESKA